MILSYYIGNGVEPEFAPKTMIKKKRKRINKDTRI